MATSPTLPIASKLEATRRGLEDLARTLGPDAQMPPIRQLCADFGVSLSTMGMALSALEDRSLIRRRQGSGIFVSPSIRQRNLCLICNPTFLLEYGASPIWGQMIEAARQRAGDLHQNLSIHFTQMAADGADTAFHTRLAADIADGQVQGVLSIGLPHSLTRWIEGCAVPVVSFAGPAQVIVWLSSQEIVQVGVAELARQGCRQIALWTPATASDREPPEIAQAFLGALAAHGLPFLPAVAMPRSMGNSAVHSFSSQGYEAMTRMISGRGTLPDGIVSTDDMLTQGLLMAIGRHGLRAGEDVQVATQANQGSPALLGWEDRITRLEFAPAEIVATMFAALEALMDGETPEGVTPVAPNPHYPHYQPPELLLLIRPRLVRAGEDSPPGPQ